MAFDTCRRRGRFATTRSAAENRSTGTDRREPIGGNRSARTDRRAGPYRSTMKITGSLLICSAAALFTAGALLFDDGPAPAAPAAAVPGAAPQIDIRDFAFSPITVAPGATF